MKLGRRGFLAGLVATLAVVTAGLWVKLRPRFFGNGLGAAPLAPDGRPVFPERYREALHALADRLLPDSATLPGALRVGAYTYVEREVARSEMAGARLALMRGAVQLDAVSRERAGRVFSAATVAERDQVVTAMLGGAGKKPNLDPREFMRVYLALLLEGMFADPVHGGNLHEQGWQAIAYMMHPPRPGACTPGGRCE